MNELCVSTARVQHILSLEYSANSVTMLFPAIEQLVLVVHQEKGQSQMLQLTAQTRPHVSFVPEIVPQKGVSARHVRLDLQPIPEKLGAKTQRW